MLLVKKGNMSSCINKVVFCLFWNKVQENKNGDYQFVKKRVLTGHTLKNKGIAAVLVKKDAD